MNEKFNIFLTNCCLCAQNFMVMKVLAKFLINFRKFDDYIEF